MKTITRQFLGLFFLAVLLVKICVIPVIYLDYEIRRDYIISNLCENRAQPILLCNGKCWLEKELAAAKKQDERRAESSFLAKLLSPVINIAAHDLFDIFDGDYQFSLPLSSCYPDTQHFLLSGYIEDIFRPPSYELPV